MPTVETARGPIDTGSLGTTLMHEHVFVLSTEHLQNYGDQWWDEQERVADAIAKLNELKSLGVDSIVDPTVWGLGRYIPRIQRVAEQTWTRWSPTSPATSPRASPAPASRPRSSSASSSTRA
jgi:phosphotriesterase-related protein